MPNRNPLTFSREELYQLVWSKPVTGVAKDIGLSDVAVARRCREVQVPLPPRGYWARVAAGQTPERTALPKYRDSSRSAARSKRASVLNQAELAAAITDSSEEKEGAPSGSEPTVTFHVASTPRVAEDLKEPTCPPDPVWAALEKRLAALPMPADAPEEWVHVGDNETSPPGWPETLCTSTRLPLVTVHSTVADVRARRITTHLIQVVTQLGWRFIARQPDPRERLNHRRSYETPDNSPSQEAHFLVEDERIYMSITERRTRTERPLTPKEQRERRRSTYFYYPDRYQYHPSGELTLYVSTTPGSGGFASFRDTKRRPLERRISAIVGCLLQGALDIKKRRREAAEAAEQERQEALRRERLRKTREAHAKLIRRLEAEAGAWERAKRLRRYLRAARQALSPGERIEVDLEGKIVDLLALGDDFADQLDPLQPSLRARSCFDGKDPYLTGMIYEADAEKLRSFVARVLGGDWRAAPKCFACEPSAAKTRPGDSRSGGSVR